MKAMILAAGRGERLRPLTDHTPKPLIEVGGRPLIAYHLDALRRAGVTEVVINVAWLAGRMQSVLGDGRDYGVRIRYSVEVAGELNTGGGIRAALSLLGDAPFLVISADAFVDFDYGGLCHGGIPENGLRLVLVDNPSHHPDGDFGLQGDRLTTAAPRYTYAGIGLYDPGLFAMQTRRRFPLSDVMHMALGHGDAYGLHHVGRWFDVGRLETLAQARAWANANE